MSVLRRLYSWWCGFKIGQTHYVMASPFITGAIGCCMPTECWTVQEKNTVRTRYIEYRWTGFTWERLGVVQCRIKDPASTQLDWVRCDEENKDT